MPPPITRTSNLSPDISGIPLDLIGGAGQPKYKEFDRKIRISRSLRCPHHSARSTTQDRLQEGEDTMQSYRVVAVGDRIADAVRTTMLSPGYGHPAHADVATGHGPCRQCLRAFTVGADRRILFTYDAFYGKEDIPLPGPVFIHEA